MENNLESKAKFFAQYWGQKIFNNKYKVSLKRDISKYDFIILKPTSKLMDKEIIDISIVWGDLDKETIQNNLNGVTKKDFIDFITQGIKEENIPFGVIDFLRLKGYAVEWNGISVEKQIEYGWIKLKQ